MSWDFAVIIPFFQRQHGILGRALASVSAQAAVGHVIALVVDDASPVDSQSEIADIPRSPNIELMVVKRPNGGPAAARNTGLAAVADSVRHVAFLDSDDEWSPDHLQRAAFALSKGFDFYFANHLQLQQTVGAFERAGRLQLQDHTPVGGKDDLYAYQGDMFDQIMRGNVIGTSTVVFDRQRFPGIRFREELSRAGEDYLCWMDFARHGAKFAFSSRCEATYGSGVNVYSGAQWGTAEHLDRVFNEFRYRKMTTQLHPTTAEQREFLRQKMSMLREEFGLDLLHMARRRTLPPLGLVGRQLLQDPQSAFAPLKAAVSRLARTH
jgi:succinoglycan biosynthesis protein ExoW